MNTILVPVDFSDTSTNALTYALKLFGSSPLEVTVLHIYGVESSALLMRNIDGVLEMDAKQQMNELLKNIRAEYPDVIFKSKIVKSSAVSAIVSLGNSGNYNFIVMGTKGASGLKEVFLGSVAGGVISKTSAPVIVVPVNHAFRPLEKILFAVGNNAFSDDQVIEPLRAISSMHKSKVKILHITDKKTPQVEKALAAIEDLKPEVEYTYGTGDTNKDLNNYLMKDSSALVCLVRSKKGFLDQLLNESVTLKQTFNSPVPLLILHD
jgi:nucleotide-binding universal stress UspA family protein